jgi:ferredoxin
MTTYFVSKPELAKLVRRKEQPTLLPVGAGRSGGPQASGGEPPLEVLSQPRIAQNPKGFFFPSAESVGRYGPGAAATAVQAEPVVLMGLRGCELRALKYLDKVLLGGEFQDPIYGARREAMTIVSVDCVDCRQTCFCTLVGGQPFAAEGFDVNLSPMEAGFLAEVATDRGRQWLGGAEGIDLAEATAEQLARRDRRRKEVAERVASQNSRFTFVAADDRKPALPDDGDASWQKFAADCVECAACTNVCPTCHCFYLYDQVLGAEAFERVRTWDSCLLSSYHRMAGTPNMKPTPRPELRSRLANRVLHKFSYSPEQYGLLGCVGCGRCIEACLGAIDIRDVVQELSS